MVDKSVTYAFHDTKDYIQACPMISLSCLTISVQCQKASTNLCSEPCHFPFQLHSPVRAPTLTTKSAHMQKHRRLLSNQH